MELVVKPILTYNVVQRREAASWRGWGGLQTEQDALVEVQRIGTELERLASSVTFPLTILPLSSIKSEEEASLIREETASADVVLVYAAGGRRSVLEALVSFARWSMLFVRHRSGPLYLWYEIVHPDFLRKRSDEFRQPGLGVDDVVVDNYDEVSWRLRTLYALKNTLGSRIISVGEPSGWGIGERAVELARERWGLDIKAVMYPELEDRIKEARADNSVLKQAHLQADEYLSQEGISLHTERRFVDAAFVLYKVFRDLMTELDARAITVSECMSTIIPIAQTTACLVLSLINDEGDLGFCESDLVVIPSGILLHHIAGRPVFLNDPTYPHDGVVTLAHCTAPRKMDGKNYEHAEIATHFESDYGAAPKVEFREGQVVTVLIPDFGEKVWLGFEGKVLESPFLPVCRSQLEVEMEGDWRELLREMKGFHWMMCYGGYLREVEYALRKSEIEWRQL